MSLSRRRGGSYNGLMTLIMLGALGALGIGILVTAAGIRSGAAYCELRKSLLAGDLERTQVYLDKLVTPPELFRVFEGARSRTKPRLDVVKDLNEVLTLLIRGNAQKAVLRFNALRSERLRQLLYSLPPDDESTALLRQLEKRFPAYGGLLKELKEQQKTVPDTIASNELRIRQAETWMADVAEEFARFFSFSPDPNKRAVDFYEHGILAGLPRLPQLPDGIVDLVALKRALDSAGGEVKLQGARVPERFREKLDSFRSSADLFRSQIDALTGENAELDEQLKSLKVRTYDEEVQLQAKLTELIGRVTKPNTASFSTTILHIWPAYRNCL